MAKFTTKDVFLFLFAYFMAFLRTVLGDCNSTSVTTISVYTTISEYVSPLPESVVTVTLYPVPVPPISLLTASTPTTLTITATGLYPNVSTVTETITVASGMATFSAPVETVFSLESIPTITLTSTALITHTVVANVSTSLDNSSVAMSTVTAGNTIASVPGSLNLTFPPITAGPNCSCSTAGSIPESEVSNNLSTLFHPSSTPMFSTVTPVETGVFPTLSVQAGSVFVNGTFETIFPSRSLEPQSVLSVAASIFDSLSITQENAGPTQTVSTITTLTSTVTISPIESVLSIAFSDLSAASSEITNKTVTTVTTATSVTSESVLPAISVLSAALSSLNASITAVSATVTNLPLLDINSTVLTITATTIVSSTMSMPMSMSMSTETDVVTASPVEGTSPINQYNTSATSPYKESATLALYTPAVTGAAPLIRPPRVFNLLTRMFAVFRLSSVHVRASTAPTVSEAVTGADVATPASISDATSTDVVVTIEPTTTWSTTTVTSTLTSHTTVPVVVNITLASITASASASAASESETKTSPPYTGPWNLSMPILSTSTTSNHNSTVPSSVSVSISISTAYCNHTSHAVEVTSSLLSSLATCACSTAVNASLTASNSTLVVVTTVPPANVTAAPSSPTVEVFTPTLELTSMSMPRTTTTLATNPTAASAKRFAISTAVALMLVATVAWSVL